MDSPNWQNILETLAILSIVSIFVERSLSLLFEHKTLGKKLTGKKEIIAYALSLGICYMYNFDAMGSILPTESPRIIGFFLTAAVVSGGSKASLRMLWKIKHQRKQRRRL